MTFGPIARISLASALMALAVQGSAAAGADTYVVDPAHSSARFQVPHLLYSTLWVISKVSGRFTGIQGTLRLDPADIARSSVEVVIDAASIATGEPFRDYELRGSRFFDVARYPAITFKSSSVTDLANGRLAVAGTLTMHGVSRPVVIAVSGWGTGPGKEAGSARAGFSKGTLRLDKRDYGLTAMIGPQPVCDQVEITLSLEACHAQSAPNDQSLQIRKDCQGKRGLPIIE